MADHSILERLRALRPELEERGVAALYLFGSQARGEAGPGSDVDLFFDREGKLSLLDVIGIRHFIEDRLGLRVDIMTRDSLNPLLRPDIEADSVPVF